MRAFISRAAADKFSPPGGPVFCRAAAFKRYNRRMNIDLHVHSSPRSSCARASVEEQAFAAQRAGLDGIVFTDHHRLVPHQQLSALEQAFAPLRVWGGVEITTLEDFLILGVDHPALESTEWEYPDLWRFVRQQGGYLVLAHAFRYAAYVRGDVARLPPDAIDLYSHNTQLAPAAEILQLAQRLGCAVLSNSDAHIEMQLGRYYTELVAPPTAGFDLLTALRALPTGLYYDGQLHSYPLTREKVYED